MMFWQHPRFHSLQARLIVVFLLLILFPLTGIGLYDHFFTNNALVPQVLRRVVREVHLQARHLVDVLDRARGDIFLLSNLRSMLSLRALMREDQNAQTFQTWYQQAAQDLLVFSTTRPAYQQIQYIDAQGDEIIRIDFNEGISRIAAAGERRNQRHTPYFEAAMARPVGEVFVSSLDVERRLRNGSAESVPLIRYALKLENDDGLVVISLHAGYVLGDLAAYANRPDHWAVFDQDGYFLLYGDQFFDPGVSASARAQQRIQAVYPQATRLLQGDVGIFETDSHVLVYNTVYPTNTQPDRFWVIYYDTPKAVLLAEITNFHYTVAIFLLGTVLIALALSMVASEQIVTPILDLKRRVELFGRHGIMPNLPEPSRQDEIGALHTAFFDMAQELERKRREQRRLIEQLIFAQEEERKLIAFDLHDGLIQQMVGARFHLINVWQQCSAEERQRLDGLQRGCDALTEAITEGRRIIEGLHPSVLDHLGLAAALEEIARSMTEAAGWELHCDLEHLPEEPEKAVSVTLYRIAQEALNNIRKHAQATKVSVKLSNSDGLLLTIQDNGCGFNLAAKAEAGRGMGITTMRERAGLVAGVCTITSAADTGTTVVVWVPCNSKERVDD